MTCHRYSSLLAHPSLVQKTGHPTAPHLREKVPHREDNIAFESLEQAVSSLTAELPIDQDGVGIGVAWTLSPKRDAVMFCETGSEQSYKYVRL